MKICDVCGLPMYFTYDNSVGGKFKHFPEIYVSKEKRKNDYPDWFFHGCDGCKNDKSEKCKNCGDYCNFIPPMEKEAWELEMHKRRYHGKIYRVS